MNTVNVVVTFLQGETTTITNKPFLEVIRSIFAEKLEDFQPLKIYFPKTGKLLYADKTVFTAFINDEISTEEAIYKTQCDALCRNNQEIFDDGNNTYVDAGALWLKKGNNLRLADDDFEIFMYYNQNDFTII
jgi:hypothetical protein